MKRLLAVILGLALALVGTMAVAAWLSTGSASATATATSVNRANAPAATAGLGTVSLSWTASTLANGAPVGGYRVVRHNGATTTTVCAVASPALTCSDGSPVGTTVSYSVIATIGSRWEGQESTTTSFTYDDVAPSAPTFTGISDDTGSSASDHVTKSAAQNLLGTAEAGSSVIVKKGASAVCTVTANGSGVFSCPVTLTSGSNAYTATATDGAGNTSSPSAAFTVTLDQAISMPTFTGISDDTGSSASDQVTKTAAQTLFGSADPNTSVTIKKDAVTECATAANGSGVFTCAVTLASGTNTYTATATDLAGNTAPSVNVAVTLDQSAPGVPTFTGISNDTGSSASDRITNVAAQNLLGSAETSSTVTVTRGGTTGCTVAATSGAFSCPVTLGSGANVFTATAVDLAGNPSGTSATFTVTLDQTTATPIFTGISNDTGSSSSDAVTNVASQNVLGAAEAGSAITIKKTGIGQPVCTTTANGSGVFSCAVTLTTGPTGYTATVTDVAGNSATSSIFTVTLDTTSPVIGTVEPGTESGGWAAIACSVSANVGKPCAGATDNLSMASMTMTLAKGVTGRCWDGGSGSNFVVAATCPVITMSVVSGVWVPANTLARAGGGAGNFTDGSYTLVVTATDTAGNAATQTSTFTVSGG